MGEGEMVETETEDEPDRSPEGSSSEPGDEKSPRRVLAIMLAVVAPWGTGHFYAGFARRARAWLSGMILGLVLLEVLLLVLAGTALRVPILVSFVLFTVLSWVAPGLDLLRLPLKDVRQPALAHVLAFGVAAFALSTIAKLGVRGMLVEPFKVPSGGMAPTLEVQDHVMVDKWRYGPVVPLTSQRLFANLPPERGELVVFEYPDPTPGNQRMDFIKRVVAVGGDILRMESGHPIINDWRVPSCLVGKHTIEDHERAKSGDLFVEFLGSQSYLVFIEDTDSIGDARQGPYQVAAGEFWVLGDNRRNSADSRSWNGGRGGGVPYALLKGRALFIWLGFTPSEAVDWPRIGLNLLEPPRPPRNASPETQAGLVRCLATKPARTIPPRAGVLARNDVPDTN